MWATKWFMLVYTESVCFPVTVRIWDYFLYKGYDATFTVAITILKHFESKLSTIALFEHPPILCLFVCVCAEYLLTLHFEDLLNFFRSLEYAPIDPALFVKLMQKNKVHEAWLFVRFESLSPTFLYVGENSSHVFPFSGRLQAHC